MEDSAFSLELENGRLEYVCKKNILIFLNVVDF
jgi:hypothetical protein